MPENGAHSNPPPSNRPKSLSEISQEKSNLLFVEPQGLPKEHFLIPHHYEGDIDRILLPQGLILDRIEKLAYDIAQAYKDEELNLICILKGSRSFFNHLIHFLNKLYTYGNHSRTSPPYLEHYVRIKSYHNTSSTGNFEVIADDLTLLRNKCVLIVEDIIDTGHTLTKFSEWLNTHVQPKSIAVTSLLLKRLNQPRTVNGNFVGFEIPDEFVVGFGLDYNERFRDLDHICVLNQGAVARYAE